MWEEKPLWTFIKANWSQLLLLHPLALEDDCATVLQFDWLNVPLLTSSPSKPHFILRPIPWSHSYVHGVHYRVEAFLTFKSNGTTGQPC
jgi:hypothetical protein